MQKNHVSNSTLYRGNYTTLLREIIFPLLGLCGFIIFAYDIIGQFTSLRTLNYSVDIITRFDFKIPFIPVFVLPYTLITVYPFLMIYTLIALKGIDVGFFRRLFIVLYLMLTIHFCIWLVFPTNWYMIQQTVGTINSQHEGVLSPLLIWVYHICNPWNSFPSLHVAVPWFCLRIIKHYAKKFQLFVTGVSLAIVCSTMLIKVHYIADVLAGMLIAEICYLILLKLDKNDAFKHSSNKSFMLIYSLVFLAAIVCSPLMMKPIGIFS